MEARLVALEEPGGIKCHHRVLKGHPAAMEAPSGVMRFTMEALVSDITRFMLADGG
jgi:hypothetical protein